MSADEARPALDEETAAVLLADLSAYYKEPVLPLSQFCSKMRVWFEAVHAGAARERTEHQGRAESLQTLSEAISAVDLAIYKSACLNRLLYGGEALRTQPCPIHAGRWSGCIPGLPPCATADYPQGCLEGSNVTGWLPLPEQVAAQRAWAATREHLTCLRCERTYHVLGPERGCPYCSSEHSGRWNTPCFCLPTPPEKLAP